MILYKLTNIGIAILDLKGNILVATGWQDICTKFHRVHPDTLKNCIESDLHLTENVNEGEYLVYKCKNNMWDMATPIFIGGKHTGNLYLGQFFFEDEVPDIEVFEAQAQRYGFDKDEYLTALKRTPLWSKDKVHTVMTFYSKFASMIGELSYSNLSLAKTLIESKILAETLRESEERHRSLVEHLPQRIFIKDRNSVYLSCNGNYASDLEITPEEIVGKNDFAFHPPELARVYRADDQDCMATGIVKDIEESYQPAGQERWVHTIKVPYHDGQGQVIGVLGIFEDITDRKRAEEALRKSEERIRLIVDNSPLGIIHFDSDGVVTDCNQALLQIMGSTREQIIGFNLLTSLRNEGARKAVESALSGKVGGFAGEYTSVTGHKTSWLNFEYAPFIGTDGLVSGGIGIFQDISERKRLEEEKNNVVVDLQDALSEVKKLSGFLPICSSCKKIRDDKGYWQQVENYVSDHSEALFSHSICPDCMRKLYPEIADEVLGRLEKDEKK